MSAPAYRRQLALLLWAATPEQPALCAAPFIHAAAAAALDCTVELHFSGAAARLLVAGVADALRPWPDTDAAGDSPSIGDLMRQAHAHGARFIGCAMAMRTAVRPDEMLIAEYDGTAGATAFVDRALDPDWATLVF